MTSRIEEGKEGIPMKILFDNVLKDAKRIFDWGNLELEDQQRLKGIMEVLESCRRESAKLEQAEKALEAAKEQFDLDDHQHFDGENWVKHIESTEGYKQVVEALKAIRE
jgi:hypothetical protein